LCPSSAQASVALTAATPLVSLIAPGPPLNGDEHVPRQHYSLSTTVYFCGLVLRCCTSFQSATSVLRFFFPEQARQGEIPHATSGRNWLLRLGYYKLHCPKEPAGDCVWLADHAVQIGKHRFLGIVAVRLAHLPPPGECLELRHLHPIALLPVEASSQEIVSQQLEETAQQHGVPRAILSDEGSDLSGGAERFCETHPETAWVSDMPHKAARLLKRRLEKNERWNAFCSQAAQTKFQTGQTELAFLTPPRQRTKARYMNLQQLLRWARQVVAVLEDPPQIVLTYCSAQRLEEKFGWLREYREEVERWSRWLELTDTTVEIIRGHGYSAPTAIRVSNELSTLVHDADSCSLRDELIAFVQAQSAKTHEGERLPGSTEVLESSFGKLKAIEGDQQRSGFTSLILIWCALFGDLSSDLIARAMNATPLKAVKRWMAGRLGPTVQSKRAATTHALRKRAAEKPEET
jgi:hypothetical protein